MLGKMWVCGSLIGAMALLTTAAGEARADDHRWGMGRPQWAPPAWAGRDNRGWDRGRDWREHGGWDRGRDWRGHRGWDRDRDWRGRSEWGRDRYAWWRRGHDNRWWNRRDGWRDERRHDWWRRDYRRRW